jgi:hypothetical protein
VGGKHGRQRDYRWKRKQVYDLVRNAFQFVQVTCRQTVTFAGLVSGTCFWVSTGSKGRFLIASIDAMVVFLRWVSSLSLGSLFRRLSS